MSRDYIVVYEEPIEGPAYDEVNIQLAAQDSPRLDADFSCQVTNRSGLMALIGLICAALGGLIAIATAIIYIFNYPEKWWDNPDYSIQRLTAALGSIGIILLILGNLLVGFGRRLHAFGALHAIHARR